MRSVSSSVMPATGSSSSSSCGSCISSMPISSHCFWPCDSSPAVRCASAVEMDQLERRGDAVELPRRRAGANSVAPHPLVGLHRELEVLEHRELLEHRRLLELAADAGVRRSRPRSARVRSIVWPKNAVPVVGPGLAGDDVHHRRLAGAVRADDAAQLAGVDRQREPVQRLEAVEADGDVVEVEDRAMRRVETTRERPSSPIHRHVRSCFVPPAHSPASPRGRNSVTMTKIDPSA